MCEHPANYTAPLGLQSLQDVQAAQIVKDKLILGLQHRSFPPRWYRNCRPVLVGPTTTPHERRQAAQLLDHLDSLLPAATNVLAGVDRLEHRRNLGHLG